MDSVNEQVAFRLMMSCVRSKQTPETSMVWWWHRRPKCREHVNGFRLPFIFHPVQFLLFSSPVKTSLIPTIPSLGLPLWISCHGCLSRSLETRTGTGQHLQARGVGMSQRLVLVEIVGSLWPMMPGDRAGASGALLYRSASLTGLRLVMGAFSMGRGRARSLVRNWWHGAGILRLKKTVFCDAVALRSSGRRVSGRGVDALESRAEV